MESKSYVEGDRVRIKQTNWIAPKFHGQLGVIGRCHPDEIYTVYIVGLAIECIFLGGEMEKTND